MENTQNNTEELQRVKGQVKRVLAGNNVREYDYKTILVPGDLHYAIKSQAYSEGLSIRGLIEMMFVKEYGYEPNINDVTTDND